MTIDLVPTLGIRLPAESLELRFGMSHTDVCRVLERRMPVADAFVCGSDWATSFNVSGCSVTVSSSGSDLTAISVSRRPTDEHAAGPVAFLDIDVFGWPASEIVKALRAEGQPVAEYHSGNVWVGDLHLSSAHAGEAAATVRRKPRRHPPRVFDCACLYAPGRPSRGS